MTNETSLHGLFDQSFARLNRFALDHGAMLFDAGEVIGKRTAQMASHGLMPNPRELGEMQRMVAEKQAASFQASLGAWNEWMRLGLEGWLDAVRIAMQGGAALVPSTIGGIADAAARDRSPATHAVVRSMFAASRHWMAPLEAPLKIVDAAFKPVRACVAANRERLST